MPGCDQRTGRRIATAVLVAVALYSLNCPKGSAQPPEPELPEPARSPRAEQTLFLMARTGPNVTSDLLRETLSVGLKTAKCQFLDPIDIEPVPATVYAELSRLIGRGEGLFQAVAQQGDISLRPLPIRESIWELRLGKPSQTLQSLTIHYEKAGDKRYTTTVTAKPEERATLILPGRYAVPLLENDNPKSFTVKVKDITEGVQEYKEKWPEMDRFYAVTIRRFLGEQQELFAVLGDSDQVGNPVKVSPVENFSFAFATIQTQGGEFRRLMDGNEYVARQAGPSGRRPKRVWMLFPLDEKEADQNLEEYGKLNFTSLPEAIRKTKPVMADEPAVVNANTGPQWFELPTPGAGQEFTRRIRLEGFRDLQQKYTRFYRLIVWEFEPDNPDVPQQAIAVEHPDTGNNVYVLKDEVKELPAEVATRADAEKAPDTPPPSDPGER